MTCDACKATGVPLQRDQRIPRRWGGTYHPSNTHYLCTDCHARKSTLELRLTRGQDDDPLDEWHDAWHAIAFPEPVPLDATVYVTEWDGGDSRAYLYARLLIALQCRLLPLATVAAYSRRILQAVAPRRVFSGSYSYRGSIGTDESLINMRCDPIRRGDGGMVVGHGKQLVIDASGRRHVVIQSELRRS